MSRKRDFFTTISYGERISDRRRHMEADGAPVALRERARTSLRRLTSASLSVSLADLTVNAVISLRVVPVLVIWMKISGNVVFSQVL